ncbi:MAG: photosynthetic complex assembly protein PuhC [Paracoccaceae bacterium]
MAAQFDHEKTPEAFPRGLLLAVGLLLATSLVGVAYLRLSGFEPINQGPTVATAELSSTFVIETDSAGGGTAFLHPETGAVLGRLAEGKDGFLRGLLRALERQRMQNGVSGNPPVELIRWEGGHLALRDPATTWRIELIGFGRDNYATMVQVLSAVIDNREAMDD